MTTTPVLADTGAHGAAANSPGVASGNAVEVPVTVPVNICGNTVDPAAVGNPSVGNACGTTGDHAPESAKSTKKSTESAPERHLKAASLMAPDAEKANDPREQLPSVLVRLMQDIGIPNGIGGDVYVVPPTAIVVVRESTVTSMEYSVGGAPVVGAVHVKVTELSGCTTAARLPGAPGV